MGVESGLTRSLTVVLLAVGRHRHQKHPDPERSSDTPADLVAVDTGKPDVDERDLRNGRQRELHAPGAVARHLDPVAVDRQDPLQSLPDAVVVLDEEDVPGLDRDSSTPVAPPGPAGTPTGRRTTNSLPRPGPSLWTHSLSAV